MSDLPCRFTFRPENPIDPPIELLAAMCIIRSRPPRLPLPANDNLRRSA